MPNGLAAISSNFTKLPHKAITQCICIVAVIYIAALSAKMTWLLIEPQSKNIGAIKSSSSNNGQPSAQSQSVDALVALNLFGKVEASTEKDTQAIQDAPQTTLRLTLAGVVASSNPDTAAAIIESNGAQETYGIGDKIKNTRATLEQVYADRVIIDRSGRMETLMLDGFDYQKAPTTPRKVTTRKSPPKKQPQVIDQRGNRQLSRSVKQFKEDIVKNPGKITTYLNISPKRVNNQVVGFSLRPGRDSEFFKTSGLKAGDVAIQMNGLDLADGAQAQEALKLLRTEQQLSLLVERNGELTEILFSIEN